MLKIITGHTYHARHGAITNAFRYSVDYLLHDFNGKPQLRLFSFDKFNLWSLHTTDHGGMPKSGVGLKWFNQVLSNHDLEAEKCKKFLITAPRFLWFEFNPVSFWIATIDDAPVAMIAEVNSTFGQRHCYFCAKQDLSPIKRTDSLKATKLMHVSPFQQIAGEYTFNLDITAEKFSVRIDYRNGSEGVLATLDGRIQLASDPKLAYAAIRRPFGALRVLALIHWQAIKLWFKKAPFMGRQSPPTTLVSKRDA